MEAKELKLGNWISSWDNDNEFIIDTSLMMDLMNEAQVMEGKVSVNPIPLTEEWLLKFGFISDGEKIQSFNLELEEYCTLSIDIDGVWMVGYSYEWGSGPKSIKHVHQLQNLYFALTGEELIIK